jgi:hypothetical protein
MRQSPFPHGLRRLVRQIERHPFDRPIEPRGNMRELAATWCKPVHHNLIALPHTRGFGRVPVCSRRLCRSSNEPSALPGRLSCRRFQDRASVFCGQAPTHPPTPSGLAALSFRFAADFVTQCPRRAHCDLADLLPTAPACTLASTTRRRISVAGQRHGDACMHRHRGDAFRARAQPQLRTRAPSPGALSRDRKSSRPTGR